MKPMGAAVTEKTRSLPGLGLNDPTEAGLAGCAPHQPAPEIASSAGARSA
jgi:hypothetical protein